MGKSEIHQSLMRPKVMAENKQATQTDGGKYQNKKNLGVTAKL
jgi:hypothetical protein